jgi:hypothetical protein
MAISHTKRRTAEVTSLHPIALPDKELQPIRRLDEGSLRECEGVRFKVETVAKR